MAGPHQPLQVVSDILALSDQELGRWALGWARFAPTVLLVPAFGLRALPVAVRVVLGLSLAAAVVPAVRSVPGHPWVWQLIVETTRGLPVAISAAVGLWAATMAGGLVDDLRGVRQPSALPNVESGATVTGAVLSMLAAIGFLETGGAARVARRLGLLDTNSGHPLVDVAAQLASGIEIAVAVAAPIVAAAIVVEVAGALIARAASPAFLQPVMAPLRSVLLLAVAALMLDHMAEMLVAITSRKP
jgi:type III secretory pathway component EscT